jgi:hypothetical protein
VAEGPGARGIRGGPAGGWLGWCPALPQVQGNCRWPVLCGGDNRVCCVMSVAVIRCMMRPRLTAPLQQGNAAVPGAASLPRNVRSGRLAGVRHVLPPNAYSLEQCCVLGLRNCRQAISDLPPMLDLHLSIIAPRSRALREPDAASCASHAKLLQCRVLGMPNCCSVVCLAHRTAARRHSGGQPGGACPSPVCPHPASSCDAARR